MGHFQIRAVLVHRLSRAALATDCIVDLMVTQGNTGDHSSFCSKAAGQYGLLLTLWSFMEECPVFKSTIMVASVSWIAYAHTNQYTPLQLMHTICAPVNTLSIHSLAQQSSQMSRVAKMMAT